MRGEERKAYRKERIESDCHRVDAQVSKESLKADKTNSRLGKEKRGLQIL